MTNLADPALTLNNQTHEQAFLSMNRDEHSRLADRNLREISHTPRQVRTVSWPCLTLGIVVLFVTNGRARPSEKRRDRYGRPLEHAELSGHKVLQPSLRAFWIQRAVLLVSPSRRWQHSWKTAGDGGEDVGS
jgi:hypothetical protein